MEKELLGEYRLVLGLEIHLHLKTKKKMFCGCSADIWGKEPNSVTCPVCLGLPGALPVANFEAIRETHILGLALNCQVNNHSRFDRKHYFYPDLPKGYQISQYKQPLCVDGKLELESGVVADIERVHLEEDVAKSFHEGDKTLVDFNKSGIPLVEIVSRPCFKTISDATDYCKKIQQIARIVGISEADMEKGQMRLEANISLRTSVMESNNILPTYKVEVKNINSFKFMEKAVLSEITRQRELLEQGITPEQENRGFKESKSGTVLQRSKEDAKDYRYFPEPDIPPMEFDDKYIEDLKKEIPELSFEARSRLIKEYKVRPDSARILVENIGTSGVEKFKALIAEGVDPQKAINILINKPEALTISVSNLVKVIAAPSVEIEGTQLQDLISKVIKENQKAVLDYKNGKESALQFLLGSVLRQTTEKLDTNKVRELLVKELSS